MLALAVITAQEDKLGPRRPRRTLTTSLAVSSRSQRQEKYEKAQLSWFMDYILGL